MKKQKELSVIGSVLIEITNQIKNAIAHLLFKMFFKNPKKLNIPMIYKSAPIIPKSIRTTIKPLLTSLPTP